MLIVRAIILSIFAFFGLQSNLMAVHLGGNDLPWSQPMSHALDKPVNDKYNGKAFFMNLGPTGIRARINKEAPKHFKVMFVFQDKKSPARGKIKIGDVIVGANGKQFQNPHGFHRKQGGRGWVGPPFELAQAIESSQGKDGKLSLMVYRGGNKNSKANVILQLERKGRFSKTYPWNCDRSDRLRKDLADFMIDNGIKGRHHYQIQQMLALIAAGDKRIFPQVKAKAKQILSSKFDPAATGMATWGWGYSGIFLGEYYRLTKDKAVKAKTKEISHAYEIGMDFAVGGFSHRPYPFIQQRASDTGVKGYGAMAGPGGLSMLAQSIFKANGLPYSERAYERTHQSFLQTVGQNNPKASIAYGFKTWENLLVRLKNPKSPCYSGKGNGYECKTGMKNIGPFIVEKWTKNGNKWDMKLVPSNQYPWLKSEASRLLVYETNIYVDPNVRQRRIIRPTIIPEPKKPFSTQPGGGGHCAPMGMGAAAHFIGNEGNKSWNYLGSHLASGCALSPGMLFDGHADATMHGFFSVVGAARAKKEHLRTYLDYVKTLIVLSETHDGQGLVEQPFGCQRNSTCSISRDRTAYTHVMLLLLSLPQKNLLITGAEASAKYIADSGRSKSKTSSSSRTSTRSSSSSAKPAKPGFILADAIQSDGFEVKFNKTYLSTIKGGKSAYNSTLKKLDRLAVKDNPKGKEAKIFAEKLRKIVSENSDNIFKASMERPAATHAQLLSHLKMIKGMDQEAKLKKRLKEIEAIYGTKTLSSYFADLNNIEVKLNKLNHSSVAVKFATKSKLRLVAKLEKFLKKEDLNKALKEEAGNLLKSLKSTVSYN